jgi:hypothetical protein
LEERGKTVQSQTSVSDKPVTEMQKLSPVKTEETSGVRRTPAPQKQRTTKNN